MNYTKIYDQLITKAQLREMPNEYCEIHHIVPRCFYGSDDDRNLVVLTLREHFIAHRLLAKMHPWHRGLLSAVAAFMMKGRDGKRIINSRQFEIAREAARKANTGENSACYGKKLTKEHRAKLSAAQTANNNPMFGKKHTDKSKAGMSAGHKLLVGDLAPRKGIKHRNDSKVKMKQTKAARKHLRKPYPYITESVPKATCLVCIKVVCFNKLTTHKCSGNIPQEKRPKVTCLSCKRVIAASRLTYHSCLVNAFLADSISVTK